jgi:hypothetical protein
MNIRTGRTMLEDGRGTCRLRTRHRWPHLVADGRGVSDPACSTGWRSTTGTVASGPDVVQVAGTELWLAGRSTDSTLMVRRQNGATFGGWQNLGGVITSAPALMVETGTTRIWAFARATTARSSTEYGQPEHWRAGARYRWCDLEPFPGSFQRRVGTVDPSRRAEDIRLVDGPVGCGLPPVVLARVAEPDSVGGRRTRENLGGIATAAPDASYGGEVIAARRGLRGGGPDQRCPLAQSRRPGGLATQ